MAKMLDNITQAVGQTPLIRLNRHRGSAGKMLPSKSSSTTQRIL